MDLPSEEYSGCNCSRYTLCDRETHTAEELSLALEERGSVQRWIVNGTATPAEFEDVKSEPQKMMKERPQEAMKKKENRAFFIAS